MEKTVISCLSQCRSHSACSNVQYKAEVFVLSKSFLIVIFLFQFHKKKISVSFIDVTSINIIFFSIVPLFLRGNQTQLPLTLVKNLKRWCVHYRNFTPNCLDELWTSKQKSSRHISDFLWASNFSLRGYSSLLAALEKSAKNTTDIN